MARAQCIPNYDDRDICTVAEFQARALSRAARLRTRARLKAQNERCAYVHFRRFFTRRKLCFFSKKTRTVAAVKPGPAAGEAGFTCLRTDCV